MFHAVSTSGTYFQSMLLRLYHSIQHRFKQIHSELVAESQDDCGMQFHTQVFGSLCFVKGMSEWEWIIS